MTLSALFDPTLISNEPLSIFNDSEKEKRNFYRYRTLAELSDIK